MLLVTFPEQLRPGLNCIPFLGLLLSPLLQDVSAHDLLDIDLLQIKAVAAGRVDEAVVVAGVVVFGGDGPVGYGGLGGQVGTIFDPNAGTH